MPPGVRLGAGRQDSRSLAFLLTTLRPVTEFVAYLEENSGRCRVHVFQELPLYVRRRVLKEGVVLLCKDWDALYAIACRTAQAFEDFKPAYRLYLDQVEHVGS